MSTVIRHHINNSSMSLVITNYSSHEGFIARVQTYTLLENSKTSFDTSQIFSTEQSAIRYFNEITKESK